MEKLQFKIGQYSGQKNLHNTGGPRSRVRTEKIRSSIFESKEFIAHNEIHSLKIPAKITNIDSWILAISKRLGWNSLETAIPFLNLPIERLLVIPINMPENELRNSDIKIIRSAVILSKCSNNYYCPDSPMIFTRNRLDKKVELIKIDLNNYYGVD
ncbi:hypothetical protein BH10BAC5_BH10BAC5_25780 [soil metagenome]